MGKISEIKSLTYICPVCKNEFHPTRKEYTCCSRRCGGIYRKTKVRCDFCGREFFKERSAIKRYSHNFCSPKCYRLFRKKAQLKEKNPNWKGGVSSMKKTGNKKLRQRGLNTRSIGASAEREVKKILEEQGYIVIKAGGSLGIWDLWAVNQFELKHIQVKSYRYRGNFRKLFAEDIKKMRAVEDKTIGSQELWVKRKGLKKKKPLERYEIIKI